MRVDELPRTQRLFLQKLYKLCKKYNAEIIGDDMYFNVDGVYIDNIDIDHQGLKAYIQGRGNAYIRDEYHNIITTCEDVDVDGDGGYICHRVTAKCSKCGRSATISLRWKEEAEKFVVDVLEEMPCK